MVVMGSNWLAKTESSTTDKAKWLAPAWHTALLVLLIVSVAIVATWLGKDAMPALAPDGHRNKIASVYAPMMVTQWGLFFYVTRVARSENALPYLLGRGRSPVVHVALAAGIWFFVECAELGYGRLFGSTGTDVARAMLPVTPAERLTWVAVSISAGFCEEVVYRGYIQAQLLLSTGSIALALVAQALLSGVAHADQGVAAAARFAAYGFAFGAVAFARRSLIPCILAHVGIDLTSGLLG